jgi:hypothetical protein
LEFFEEDYVGRKGRTGWLKGKFPIKIWNQWENVLEGRQLSTNRHEGWHSRLRKSLATSTTFWTLMEEQIDIEATSRADREDDLDNGHTNLQSGKSRRLKELRKKARAKLRDIMTNIDDYEMVDYLKKIGYFKGHL